MLQLFQNWLLIALGVLLAANTSPGISYDGDIGVLLAVVILISVLNLFLKPLLVIFTLPFVVLTMGLGLWVINAVIIYIVGGLVERFTVESFWSALWAALIISLVSMVVNTLLGRKKSTHIQIKTNRSGKNDDVIDV